MGWFYLPVRDRRDPHKKRIDIQLECGTSPHNDQLECTFTGECKLQCLINGEVDDLSGLAYEARSSLCLIG